MGVKSSLDESGLHPRKKWGQHFLTDTRILEGIAAAADIGPEDTILEIGPGLGHLTRVLAARAGRVVAVEIDAGLAEKLSAATFSIANIEVIHGDILALPAQEWLKIGGAGVPPQMARPAPYFKIIANLPYYITSAILRHVLEAEIRPSIIVVMVQREVAQRMMAKPPEMNLLAVSVQFFAGVRVVRTIAPGAFYPPPKVESAVIRLDVVEHLPLSLQDTRRFFELVRAGFGERRKQLRNSLARGLGLDPSHAAQLLQRASIDPTRRAETLSLDEWNDLFRVWARFPIVSPGNRM